MEDNSIIILNKKGNSHVDCSSQELVLADEHIG